ncbi:PREDICTED: zinc finger protein 99-like isoform X2 [Nicrophorus vespilloides]|uniref:Zinc finger protein 99-like isoform X2 n=1 Tax=Nicrophorus vespilloides TaxID=110193 RepID=A0ABM1MXR2_NICVS|nr:PREDICTED: zinc finger protein 99-like isoform X2 [Nicrophorus vespilloides]
MKMIADYDDVEDSHFCLKCHQTITGLDNYVTHRKNNCVKSEPDPPKSPPSSELLPQDYAFSLKADDFFSSLELQSSSKKTVAPSTSGKTFTGILTRSKTSAVIQEKEQSKSGKNAWIGGHQLKELGTGDNHTKLIKAVDNLSRNASIKKEDVSNAVYTDEASEDTNYEDDDFDDEYIPSGGKWAPQYTEPAPSYTGGKWKPKRMSLIPPQSHTKGKWKPEIPEAPNPPSKSKIKISSQSKKSGKDFWCVPCNRKLASKVVYDRHLKSELHLKRTLQEFDDSPHLNTKPDKETKAKPVEYWPHAVGEDNEDTMKNAVEPKGGQKRKRAARRIYVKCSVCKSRVTTHLMGKHLISHYHCRKGDINTPEAHAMVLDNMHKIVLHSPYQCGTCKFYFNTHLQFLQHWNSADHKSTMDKTPGYILCSFCKFSCEDNDTMFSHLISIEHKEVISVINRSVPIVIKKIRPLKCSTCSEEFMLNIQLRIHCKTEDHQYSSTSTNEYQMKEICEHCNLTFKSLKTLQVHISNNHQIKNFYCSICSLQFDSLEESVSHRKSPEHRCKAQNKPEPIHKCEYCSLILQTFVALKDHLREAHPERLPSCVQCGEKFSVPQELTVHIRSKLCKFTIIDNPFKCNKCPYSTKSNSELLYHQALHTEGIPQTDSNSKTTYHYKCPLCTFTYPKSSLRYHIQNHTNEKSYRCDVCGAKFARKSHWKAHLKIHEDPKREYRSPTDGRTREHSYLCAICGVHFNKNSTLQKHMLVHTGKTVRCPVETCVHFARSEADLKSHMTTHSDERNYPCDLCQYRGKSVQQLKRHKTMHEDGKKFKCQHCSFTTRLQFHLVRHERIHTGSKPFVCPHCDYRSNNLENLRKHVMATNKHPGRCMYECKFCEGSKHYKTNLARDFKVHLMMVHGDDFPTQNDASNYITGICHGVESVRPKEKTDEDVDDDLEEIKIEVVPKVEVKQHGSTMFPVFIVSKEEGAVVERSTWTFEAEENSNLDTFNDENASLFQEHFQ